MRAGNCGAKGQGELTWSNAAEAAAEGVTIEPAQARLDPGQQVPVKFSYTPPEGGGGALGLWRTVTVEGTLRGGDPSPQGGTVPISVRLRFYSPAKT